MGGSLNGAGVGAQGSALGEGTATALGVVVLLSLGSVIYPTVGVPWILLLVLGGAARSRLLGRGGLRSWLKTLDDAVFRGERAVVALCLGVMAVVVFMDVVWRTARGVDPATGRALVAGLFVLVMLASFTARWPGASAVARAGVGVALFFGLLGAVWLVARVENGFGWSQRLALVLVIWVGLLGGSMATRLGRHIAVDAARRIVPPRFSRGFEAVSGLVTVATCGFLAVVGGMYCRGNVEDWWMADRRAFLFESLPIPYWVATLAMPIGFGLMAVRFLAATIRGPDGSGSDPGLASDEEDPR